MDAMIMRRTVFVLASLLFIQHQCQAQEEQTYGDLTFRCKSGWRMYQANCYLSVQATQTYSRAKSTCNRQGGNLLKLDNDIEYIKFVSTLTEQDIWLDIPSEEVQKFPLWGNYQPIIPISAESCVLISKQQRARYSNCENEKTFVCKYQACLKDYRLCATGGKCIHNSYLCDGTFDCPDQSDERQCPNQCRNYIQSSDVSGSFSNPFLGDFMSCTWIIEVPPHKRLSITIPTMTLETNVAQVKVYSGSPSLVLQESTLLKSLTGSVTTQMVYSKNNFIILTFTTDDVSQTISKYAFSWTTAIPLLHVGIRELAAVSTIMTLTFPYNMQVPDLSLVWLIQAGEKDVITFYLEGNVADGDSYIISFRDGDEGMAYQRLMVGEYRTTGTNKLFVNMMTAQRNTDVSLRYKTGCTIPISALYGTLYSPGHTLNKIPNSLTCNWTLVSGLNVLRGMTVKFNELTMHSEDMLQVFIDANTTSIIPVLYSGSFGNIIHAEGGKIQVHLQTNAAIKSTGFKVTFGADCITLPTSQWTTFSHQKAYYQETVDVSCEDGYGFDDEAHIMSNIFSFTCVKPNENVCHVPVCTEIQCGAPPAIINGYIDSITGTTLDSTAVYECNSGFSLQSVGTPTCTRDRTWNNLPSCTSTQCTVTPSSFTLANGQAEVTEGMATLNTLSFAQYGTVVEFKCNEGYHLVGPKYTRCNDSWFHETEGLTPRCEVVRCPVPGNSNVEPHGPISYASTGNVLTCRTGFMFPNTEGSTILPVTCQPNGTLSENANCIDIDECSSPERCPDNSVCENSIGSFKCICDEGYEMDGNTCNNINECTRGIDGCLTMNSVHYCTDNPGSFSCTCPDGWELFTTNGQSGYFLPSGETGYQSSDTFRFGSTCVRTPFTLRSLTNGKYLTIANKHYYGDTVTVKCNDGYMIMGSSPISDRTTITAGVSGFPEVSCSARTCIIPTDVARGTLSRTGSISFGENVILTCTLSETNTITKTAYCIYDNSNVRLGGQDVTSCPEIDCGNPSDILPPGAIISGAGPTVTTYPTGTFTFACVSGFTIEGSSGRDTNTEVICKENGKWQLGTLTCRGVKCEDPGTPADAMQVVASYEVGQKLSFSCNRRGFLPDMNEPQEYTCQLNGDGTSASWSGLGTLPVCQDAEPPTVNICPGSPIYIETMGVLSFTEPSFTDNFAVKSITKSDVHQSGDFIDLSIQLTYTATDFENSRTTCSMEFQVIDRTNRPSLDCPATIVLNVPVTTTTTTTVSAIPSVVGTFWTEQNSTVSPSTVSASYTKIGSYEPVVATRRDELGRETKCPFVARFQAGACFSNRIHVDNNANRICDPGPGPAVSCQSTCRSGAVYRDGSTMKTFLCSSSSSFAFALPDYCLPYLPPKQSFQVEVTYEIEYDNRLCLANFNESLMSGVSSFTTKLRQQCSSSWSVSSVYTLTIATSTVTKYTVTFVVEGTSSSTDGTTCRDAITATTFDLAGQLFTCVTPTGSQAIRVLATLSQKTMPELSCVQPQYTMISTDGQSVCVPCSPGQFYSSTTSQCTSCPDGRMQDLPGQTQCKDCPIGQQPNSAKTACINSCPVGFFSTTGSGECFHCPENKYSTSPTMCTDCPAGYSTVRRKGAKSLTECFAPCPAGQYSLTGFADTTCRPCPLGSYQTATGRRSCTRCSESMTTTSTGTIAVAGCVAITLQCNRTYCSGHGECGFRLNRRHCACDSGYSGNTCAKFHHKCEGNPCKNGGTCVRGASAEAYTCTCRSDLDSMIEFQDLQSGPTTRDDNTGFYNQLLSTTLSSCKAACLQANNCLSMTFISFGSPICYLYSIQADSLSLTDETRATTFRKSKGFAGADCEQDLIDECTSNQCDASAMCMNKIGGYQCLCPLSGGLTGQYCTITRNPCSPDPCLHGTCQPFGNIRYECTCSVGWKGINCTEDIDECSYLGAECLYGGTCVNNFNGFSCNCLAQYSGSRCQITPNFCAQTSCTGNLCYNSLTDNAGKCHCDGPIYTTSGNTCNRTDPCDAGIIDCGAHGQCRNSGDSAFCTCNVGYAGLWCEHNVNYCQANSCNGHGTCVDGEENSFSCRCDQGYQGDTCNVNINECQLDNNCQNGATCRDGINTYTCQCAVGFTGDLCQTDIDDCASVPCKNGGTCEDQLNGYRCTCPLLYTGINCQTAINTCSPQPCQNEAPCFNLDSSNYFCRCAGGTQGFNCESLYDVCQVLNENLNCKNNGMCRNSDGTAVCTCPVENNIDYCYFQVTNDKSATTGSIHTTNSVSSCLDICKRDPACRTASITRTVSNSYLCRISVDAQDNLIDAQATTYHVKICPLLYDGKVCELINDACTPNPCMNEGTCTKRQCRQGFTCQCAPGYRGIRCETRDIPCMSAPCGTTATCISSLTEHICQCPQGKVLVGTTCRASSNNFVILGNTLSSNEAPKLQRPFRLEGTEMSIMLRFRVHQYSESSVIATLQLQNSLTPEESLSANQEGMWLKLSPSGITTYYNGFTVTHLWNDPDDDVSFNVFDQQWHHLGISITAGQMKLTIDAITVGRNAIKAPGAELNFAYNGQVLLGSNILAEYEDVVVWNIGVEQTQFIDAYANMTFYPRSDSIVQHWWNYYIPQASERQIARRSNLLSPETLRGMADVLNCANIQDVSYVPTNLLVNIGQVETVTAYKNEVRNQATNGQEMKHTLPTVMTVGYYPGILVRTSAVGQPFDYDYCKFGLYIKHNENCPGFRFTGWGYISCYGGVCQPSCALTTSHLSAPTPNDMACGSLGIWNLDRPKQELVLPSCQVHSSPKYVVDIDATILLQIPCISSFADQIETRIKSSFFNLETSWDGLCVSAGGQVDTCTNVRFTMSECLSGTNNVRVKFSVAFRNPTITRTGRTERINVEDVLRILILQGDDLRVNGIANGAFVKDTVNIMSTQKCDIRGETLIRRSTDQNVCVPCGEGFYVDATTGVCTPCGLGKYQSTIRAETCTSCPQGKTTYQFGARESTECALICPAGQFYDSASSVCMACPRNTYQQRQGESHCEPCTVGYRTVSTGSNRSDDCKVDCPGGQYRNADLVCTMCERGFWRSVDNDDCLQCPEGKTTMENVLADSIDKCNMDICPLGRYWNATERLCQPCPIGQYADVLYLLECKHCKPSHSTRNTGTVSGNDCEFYCQPGYEVVDGACKQCPRGKYKSADMRFNECAACQSRQTTETTGSLSAEECSIPICEIGQYIVGSLCEDCPEHTYSSVELPDSATKCVQCRDPCNTCNNAYGTEQAASVSIDQCKPMCPGGTEFNATTMTCQKCPIEKYKPDDDMFGPCRDCENDMVASESGAINAADCLIPNCQAGFKIVGSGCEACPIGTYQSNVRSTECVACGSNLSTASNGTASFDGCQISCDPGLYGITECELCPEHYFKAEKGFELCAECPEDKTSSLARINCSLTYCSFGKRYDMDRCVACDNGTYKDHKGNNATCTPCAPGTTTNGPGQRTCDVLHCVPGQYAADDACQPCPMGTFKNETGNQECAMCAEGLTTGNTGAMRASQCDTVICPVGNYRVSTQKTACTPCDFNTYQNVTNSTSCVPCPGNKVTMQMMSQSVNDCVPLCLAGTAYNRDTAMCYDCPRGTYKTSSGNVDCTACPTGKTTLGVASKSPNECSQVVCPKGSYGKIVNSAVVCELCPVGKYSDAVMLDGCTSCATAKTTLTTGATTSLDCIDDCDAGYGYDTTVQACKICPVNYFNNKADPYPNTCKLCPYTRTNTISGSTSCLLAIPDPVSPPIQLVTITVPTIYQLDVDNCNTFRTTTSEIVRKQIKSKLIQIFEEKAAGFTNDWCNGVGCPNIDVIYTSCSAAAAASRRKRALINSNFKFIFQNISKLVTDSANEAVIPAKEILAQTLMIKARSLDLDGGINFIRFETFIVSELCLPGQYRSGTECMPCPQGTYSLNGDVAQCTPCQLNHYQDLTGAAACKVCQPPKYTDTTGSVSSDLCKAPCEAGSAYNSTSQSCYSCPRATYKSNVNNSLECTACPEGKSTFSTGSTSLDDCSKVICPAGTYGRIQDGRSICTSCPIGTYNSEVMQDMCISCSTALNNRTTKTEGSVTVNQCIDICNAGSGYNTTLRECQRCLQGYYNDRVGTYPNTCKKCAAGTTNLAAGSTLCSVQDATPVKQVQVSVEITLTYQVEATSCTAFVANIAAVSIVQNNIITKLKQVLQGRGEKYGNSFCNGAGCSNIKLGKLICPPTQTGRRKRELIGIDIPVIIENVSETVQDTDTGEVIPTTEVLAQVLETEGSSLNVEGMSYVGNNIIQTTELCSPGNYKVNSQCVPCARGTYSTDGLAATCSPCPVNKYQDQTGQAQCKDCEGFKYLDQTGSSSPNDCKFLCETDTNYCNNRGACVDIGLKAATCRCNTGFEGDRCASKTEVESEIAAILGASIGGIGALLFVILLVVGIYRYLGSRQKPSKKHPYPGRDEYIYDNRQPSYYTGSLQSRQVPAVGYPATGFIQDPRLDDNAYSQTYKQAPSVHGQQDDSPTYIWHA